MDHLGQVWTTVANPTLKGLRQEDCKLEASLVYIVKPSFKSKQKSLMK